MNYSKGIISFLVILLATAGCSYQDAAVEVAGLDTYQIVESPLATTESKPVLIDLISNQQSIAFAGDNFYIRVRLKAEVNEADLRAKISIEPRMPFELHNLTSSAGQSKQWGILPGNWQVGDRATLNIEGKVKEYSFQLQKVEPPVISDYIFESPTVRSTPNLADSEIESSCILSDTKIIINFSKPMNKSSVTSIIGHSVSMAQKYQVKCSWQSPTRLAMQFSNNAADPAAYAQVAINLTGAKDRDGVNIIDSSGLYFDLYPGKAIYKYDYNSQIPSALTSNYNLGTIALSDSNRYIACTDIVRRYNNRELPNACYEIVNLNLIEVATGKSRILETLKVWQQDNKKLIWSAENYMFYNNTVYDISGSKVLELANVDNVAFSPDEKTVAVVQNHKLNLFELTVYQLQTGEILLHRELNGNDRGAPGFANIVFINDNTLIFDSGNQIQELNLSQDKIRTIVKGNLYAQQNSNFLSPDKRRCVITVNDRVGIYNLLKGRIEYSFNQQPGHIRWTADSSQLGYLNPAEKEIRIITIENRSSKTLTVEGFPLGWDNKGNLIYYN